MAKIAPYFGPHSGPLKIWLGIFQIGSGNFTAFSDFQADFAGTYSALGHSGRFAIKIALTDQNTASTSGACHIVLNGRTDNTATYEADGAKLTVKTVLNDTPLTFMSARMAPRSTIFQVTLSGAGDAAPRPGNGRFPAPHREWENAHTSPAPGALPAPAPKCYAKPMLPESRGRACEDA